MDEERRCSQCGKLIPAQAAACPACTPSRPWWRLSRESVLLWVFVAAAVVLFAVTSYAARLFHEYHDRLGEEWFARGQASLEAGDPEQAVRALRNALLYHRDHFQYRMALAQALLQSGSADEARSYLLSLWQREPGHGILNLELARFAARRGNVPEAVRYYQNAIHGLWPEQAEERRLETRLELTRFLLELEVFEEARAQVVALAAEMPRRPDLHVEAGRLFLSARDPEQALAQFEAALALESANPQALLGAGQAAFQTGNYTAARGHLAAAVKLDVDTGAAQMLETTTLVLQTDPFRWRLGSAERIRRALRAFETSRLRLEACAQQIGFDLKADEGELHALHMRATGLRPQVTAAALRRDPDLVETLMEFVFEAQRAAQRQCGEPRGADLALLLLARQREAQP
jgi:tetratricopeptide (TPR) repeat protein